MIRWPGYQGGLFLYPQMLNRFEAVREDDPLITFSAIPIQVQGRLNTRMTEFTLFPIRTWNTGPYFLAHCPVTFAC